jgi:AraC-like DNA-binding protein
VNWRSTVKVVLGGLEKRINVFNLQNFLKEFHSSCVIVCMTPLHNQNPIRFQTIARRSGFKVRGMSGILGLSQRQLQRDTRRYFGLRPLHWLKEQRLKAAGELLKQHQPIKRVCFRLGFKQLSHFSREFKLFYGVSPRQYLSQPLKKFYASGPTRRLNWRL